MKFVKLSGTITIKACALISLTCTTVDRLSAGTASASSEENHFLRGLRTRAVPAGVRRPPFQSAYRVVISLLHTLQCLFKQRWGVFLYVLYCMWLLQVLA